METYNDEHRPDPDSTTGYRVMTFDEARRCVFGLGGGPEAPPDWQNAGLTEPDVFRMIEPALERLARQVERTFEHYSTNVSGERIEQILVSSVMTIYQPMLDYIGDQLAIERDVFDPLDPKVADIPTSLSLSTSERIAFVPALGVALSDNAHTPNALFTYRQREEAVQIKLINRFILTGFLVAAAACLIILGFQFQQMGQKKESVAKLEARLAQFTPTLTQTTISDMVASMKQRRDVLRGYSERYLGMAVLGELTALTPAEIRLISLKSGLAFPSTAASGQAPGQAAPPQPAAGAPAAKGAPSQDISLEGLVMGDPASFESQLFRYRVALENSPLFKNVSVKKQDLEPFRKGRVLHFTINLQIG